MNIETAMQSCLLRSEAEAVAFGYSPELGHDMYIGIVADDIYNWNEQQFINWIEYIGFKHTLEWEEWIELYKAVSGIMSEFGGKLFDK